MTHFCPTFQIDLAPELRCWGVDQFSMLLMYESLSRTKSKDFHEHWSTGNIQRVWRQRLVKQESDLETWVLDWCWAERLNGISVYQSPTCSNTRVWMSHYTCLVSNLHTNLQHRSKMLSFSSNCFRYFVFHATFRF